MMRAQVGDDPRKDSLPCSLRNRHAGHEDDRPGKEFDAIGRKCVGSCVTDGHDTRISCAKRRLFAPYPRHFTQARPSMARACLLSGPALQAGSLTWPGHPWLLPAVFCTASCRGPVLRTGVTSRAPLARGALLRCQMRRRQRLRSSRAAGWRRSWKCRSFRPRSTSSPWLSLRAKRSRGYASGPLVGACRRIGRACIRARRVA